MSVAESTFWPKDFQELKVIDGLLRCGICYEYLRTCLVTPCSHNYCSFCIRKSMQYKTQCPVCLKETFEVNLQNNRVLDEIVGNFTSIRDKLIRHLRIAEIHLSVQQANHLNALPVVNATPIKMKTEVGKTRISKENALKLKTPQTEKKKNNDSKVKSTPKTDSKKKNIFQQDSLVIRTVDDDDSDHDSDDCFIADKENDVSSPQKSVKEKANGVVIPEIFLQPVSPKKKVGGKNKEQEDVLAVPCPVCNVHIPERNINIHLDSCLYRSERPVRKQTKPASKRSPLPKLVYNMMSEKDLRKKLKEHGLAQNGDKKTLISRLQRFTVLYNSECDAIEPMPVSSIIQQIENEEKDEKKHQQTHRTVINRNTDPKIIEEENNKYIQENKNCFEALIKAVREREGRKPKEVTIIDDDDEDEDGDNDFHDNKKVNTAVTEEISRHNVFSGDPSTSKASVNNEKEDKQPVEVVDESSDDELSVPSIITRFTPLKSLKMTNKSNIVGSGGRDSQKKCIVEVTTTLTKSEEIPVNTQKLSDEELGLYNEVSSDVNSVYHASDNEDEVNSSDNESVSLLAKVEEENCVDELPKGNLSGEGDDVHKDSENENNPNSQLEDPDFVVNTQDLDDENTEEFFQPRHKAKITPARTSKRKMVNAVLSDSDDDNGNVHHDPENFEHVDTPRRVLRKRVKH